MISCKYKWLVDRGEVFTLILPKEIKLISYRGYISRYITHVFLLKTATILGEIVFAHKNSFVSS